MIPVLGWIPLASCILLMVNRGVNGLLNQSRKPSLLSVVLPHVNTTGMASVDEKSLMSTVQGYRRSNSEGNLDISPEFFQADTAEDVTDGG